MERIRLSVYGRELVLEHDGRGWRAFHPTTDGKRRPVEGLLIPPEVTPAEVGSYLADLCHEWASERHPGVRRL